MRPILHSRHAPVADGDAEDAGSSDSALWNRSNTPKAHVIGKFVCPKMCAERTAHVVWTGMP